MKGNEMSTTLAMLLMPSGGLTTASIAHSQQMIELAILSLDVTKFANYMSAPLMINCSNYVNHYYSLAWGLFEGMVVDPHATFTFAYRPRAPTSRNISFSVVQCDDEDRRGMLNFRNTVVFEQDYVACNCLTYAYTLAIGFDNDRINSKDITVFASYNIVR